MDSQDRKLIRLADARSMREMDRHAIEDLGISGAVLMENAARSVADWLEENKLKQQPEAKVVFAAARATTAVTALQLPVF